MSESYYKYLKRKKEEEKEGNEAFTFIFVVGIIFASSIVLLAPGIAVASFLSKWFDISRLYLWLTTLIISLLILIVIYLKFRSRYIIIYSILCIAIFGSYLIYSNNSQKNVWEDTVKYMYSFIYNPVNKLESQMVNSYIAQQSSDKYLVESVEVHPHAKIVEVRLVSNKADVRVIDTVKLSDDILQFVRSTISIDYKKVFILDKNGNEL